MLDESLEGGEPLLTEYSMQLPTSTALKPPPTGHVILIGDACHGMAANLAQGASMAIEDAWDLAATIADHGVAATDFAGDYYERRADRARYCQLLTRATQSIASLPPGIRNNLQRVPTHLNSMVFDASLWVSLGAGYKLSP